MVLNLLNRQRATAIAVAFFVYVFWIRVHDVASTFLMLGEQTRDWTIALGGLTDLPLAGAPSTAGGRGFGPAYYWLLWLGRVTIGPFLDNVPHAGGITVALLQSIADTWLLLALSRRVDWGLALSMCLLIASAPFDIAISSVIWNPPVSAALIKMATASALSISPPTPLRASGGTGSSGRSVALTAALAWMAVQAHLSAIFVAAPLLLAMAVQPLIDKRLSPRVLQRGAIIAATIMLLQIPLVISILREPAAAVGPSSAIAALTHPRAVRPWLAYESVTSITGNLLLPMSDAPLVFAVVTLVLGSIVAFLYRRDVVVLGVSVGGVIMATLLFTTSTRSYDGYWFLTLTTALTLTYGLAIAAIPSHTAVKWIGLALLLLVGWRQPARIADSTRFFKYPQYGTLLSASRQLIMEAPVLRDIRVTFEVHPTMDRHFIYRILGGRIDGSAIYTAVVNSDG
ncbi:MAG: hypothetical protein ABI024_02250, partial [Vicinamibacterales bacterium]